MNRRTLWALAYTCFLLSVYSGVAGLTIIADPSSTRMEFVHGIGLLAFNSYFGVLHINYLNTGKFRWL